MEREAVPKERGVVVKTTYVLQLPGLRFVQARMNRLGGRDNSAWTIR